MTTMNPADSNACNFSNGDLTVSGTPGVHAICRSTTSKSSGKAFVQVHLDSVGVNITIGIGNASASLVTYVSNGPNSAGWANTTGGWYYNDDGGHLDFPVIGAGHDVGVGLDFDAGIVQINSDGGTFTSHAESFPSTGPLFLMIDIQGVSDQVTLNFGGSAFVGSPPSGYPAWDGAAQISGSLNSTLGDVSQSATGNAIISGVLTH